MSRTLTITRAGPAMAVQDQGRPGLLGQGISRSGAADLLALAEGAALLGQPASHAAIEMAGMGGTFTVAQDTRIALTGAPMPATIDGDTCRWNASHLLPKEATLAIGAAPQGVYGYLHLGGGVTTPPILGARSAHLSVGLGRLLADGDVLPVGEDTGKDTGLTLAVDPRFAGGTLRILPSMQTGLFPQTELDRFCATDFTRDTRANRMGARLTFDGVGFSAQGQLNILSEIIVPGDIQMTGDGTPFVLLPECQTTGGYPRIGTVIPADLPLAAQAAAGARLRFRFVTMEQALEVETRSRAHLKALPRQPHPLLRDPHDIRDLLSYQLVGGAISAFDTGDIE